MADDPRMKLRLLSGLLVACAGPLSSHVCVSKVGKTDVAALAKQIVQPVKRGGSFAVLVVNHTPELHDTSHVQGALRSELAGRDFVLRDEAECERFLRVTLEKRQMYVEVVERESRRVSYLHEYTLDFCSGG